MLSLRPLRRFSVLPRTLVTQTRRARFCTSGEIAVGRFSELLGSLCCVQSRALSSESTSSLSLFLSSRALSLHAVYLLLPVPLSSESLSSSGSVTAHSARSPSVHHRTRSYSVLREAARSTALDSILLINGQSPLSCQPRYRHAISSKCHIKQLYFTRCFPHSC